MKKSEIYTTAMYCVIESELSAVTKLEIIELLMSDKKTAEWSEKRKEEDNF